MYTGSRMWKGFRLLMRSCEGGSHDLGSNDDGSTVVPKAEAV